MSLMNDDRSFSPEGLLRLIHVHEANVSQPHWRRCSATTCHITRFRAKSCQAFAYKHLELGTRDLGIPEVPNT
jgi:hypothetical protein